MFELRSADLVLPVTPHGPPPSSWATVAVDGQTWVPAFTSPDTDPGVVMPFVELGARWPNPHWNLAVDPGLPTELLLTAGAVVRLARADDDLGILEKVVTFEQVTRLLAGEALDVSGFAHRADDADLPDDLLGFLGLGPEYLDTDGSLYLMRWAMLGPDLYRAPIGGSSEEAASALEGWVVEPPPFRGTGFVVGPSSIVREYKLDGVMVPHGSEIYRVPPDGAPEHRVALFDADQRRWLLVRPV